MTLKRKAAELIFPIAWRMLGLQMPAEGGRVILYHAIGTNIPEDTQGRYNLSPNMFAAQMEWLAETGKCVELLARVNSGVAITFDDGYRDNFTVAYPILKRLGLPFTIFVIPRFVESERKGYLSKDDLRLLAADSMVTIGSHGDSHERLTGLSDSALMLELEQSKSWLEGVTRKPVTALSYPHGAVDSRVRAAVAAAGFTLACTSEFGANEADRDSLALRRIDIWNTDDEAKFKSKLAGEWDWMCFFTRCGL